jgi:flagellar biosynthesis chaperone FliJ
MAFHFSLDSLLRLRRSELRQQELMFQKANDEVNCAQREILNLGLNIFEIMNASPHGRVGAELRFDRERQISLEQKRAALQEKLEAARERQASAAAALRESWQKREALEILRQREHDAYALGAVRREQRRQDDWFLQQRRTR